MLGSTGNSDDDLSVGDTMSLFNRKKKPLMLYDPRTQQPAVRKSICTGEMTLGFIDKSTGKFRDYMLARNQAELEEFCREVEIEVDEIKTIY